MKIRNIEAFHALMVAGTTTEAAAMLRVSQPAVSRMIGQLERDLGFPLFKRVKGRLYPTPEAEIFDGEVEKSFIGIDKLARTAEDIRANRTGHLRIVGMPALSLGFVPKVLDRFLDTRPGLNVTLEVRSSEKVVDWIAAQQFDLGLAVMPVDHPAIEVEPLDPSEAACVLPAGHPLEAKTVIVPRDLEDLPFVSLGTEHRVRFEIDQAFEEAGVKRSIGVVAQLSAVVCQLVECGRGVGIVDPFTAADFAERGVVVRPFRPAIFFNTALLYPAHRPRSRLTRDFAALLRASLRRPAAASAG
jgi:DNA-binding transcriptional LysR family regulator